MENTGIDCEPVMEKFVYSCFHRAAMCIFMYQNCILIVSWKKYQVECLSFYASLNLFFYS